MNLFQLLQLQDAEIVPRRVKIHLAGWNGTDDPLDVYFDGKFDEWQSRQTRRNFERPQVLSLISMSQADSWLLAGVYDSHGCHRRTKTFHHYDLRPRPANAALNGRLVVRFRRSGRQSYLNAERWADQLDVVELRRQRLAIGEFPGYKRVRLTMSRLKVVVRHSLPAWRGALANVKGVYVIADPTGGKLYVGSATGDDGIWGRWCNYAETSHGGNVELRKLLRKHGRKYADQFLFGILEVADSHASDEDVVSRESHWKKMLLTRVHGYNAN